jgi:hypothetical protein
MLRFFVGPRLLLERNLHFFDSPNEDDLLDNLSDLPALTSQVNTLSLQKAGYEQIRVNYPASIFYHPACNPIFPELRSADLDQPVKHSIVLFFPAF